MHRKKPLKAKLERTREFIARGRQTPLKRSRLKPISSKQIAANRGIVLLEGPLSAPEWKRQVFEATAGKCVVSGSRARDMQDWRFHAHHVVAQDVLRARGLFGYLWDARNGVLVTAAIHMAHEHKGGDARIAREYLPASVWDFCAELDALEHTQWATAHVERYHPAAGQSGMTMRRT